MNPYEVGCLSATRLFAVPVFQEAKPRTFGGNKCYPFYNPMWNFFGDFKKPYGTYYYRSNNLYEPQNWYFFDQVLIRPELRDNFLDDKLRIIQNTKSISLLDAHGHPNIHISDHLPIMFEIKEDKYDQQ